MSILNLIICKQCKGHDLDLSHVSFENNAHQGHITCRSCLTKMHFENGVLNLLSEEVISKNESRNSDAYSDFWERGKLDAADSVVTHEDTLLISWYDRIKGNVFLDAGCGNGRHMKHWIKQNFQQMVFVDISNAILDCKQKYDELHASGHEALFIKGTLNSIPIRDAAIDSTWSSGTLGLVENQKEAFQEIIRVSKNKLNLSVLTNKTLTGKIYIWANIVKPIVNRINSFSLLYKLTGFIAYIVLVILKTLYYCRIYTNFLKKETLEGIIQDKNSVRRIQWGLYDPVIIPKVVKHPDQFYIDTANQNGFKLDHHTTEVISDYYFFKKP